MMEEDPEKALEKYANAALRAILDEAGISEQTLYEETDEAIPE